MAARIWITDGSVPVFSDTQRLEAKHAVIFGLRPRYEGFVDPAVAVGSVELEGARLDDVLCLEAEWAVLTDRAAGAAGRVDTRRPPGAHRGQVDESPERDEALAAREHREQPARGGAGIATTFGALEEGGVGTVEIAYESEGAGPRRHSLDGRRSARPQPARALVRQVLAWARASGETLDAIDLGALGDYVRGRQRARAHAGRGAADPAPARVEGADCRARDRGTASA